MVAVERKLCGVEVKALDDGSDVTARISVAVPDREGDVVLPSGLEATSFKRNPVVLLQHDQSRPIGRAVSLRTTSNAVVATMKFAERPDTHPDAAEWMPDTVRSLMKQGVLSAFSVGFRVPRDGFRDATDKDMERFGAGTRRVITRWELLEFSVVSVPANAEALATAVSKGLVPDGDVVRRLGLSRDLLCEDGEMTEGTKRMLVQIPRRLRIP